VTGACSGLGERFARVLAEAGANISLAARRTDRLETLRAELEQAGAKACAVAMDVTSLDAIGKAVAATEAALGPIDILINNHADKRRNFMSRTILDEAHIHPAIREKIATHHADIVREVQDAVAANEVVVVGMAQNPMPKKARRILDAAGIAYRYLEYGSYLNAWRRRNALKMWTGWPTFPMVFVKGVLVGGAGDLESLVKSGELKQLLA